MNLGAPASLPACSRESLAGEDAGSPRLAIRSWSQSTAERAFHEPTVWCPGFSRSGPPEGGKQTSGALQSGRIALSNSAMQQIEV